MGRIETDYLVVGAGASGMAFVDALVAERDVDVVMVDRRHRPGGHWLDAYPFVRLHQPSAVYGVPSRKLGDDRIDETGPNAGFYERATGAAVCDYFVRILEEQLIPSHRVHFLGMHDYRGDDPDGHHLVSLATGAETTVKVRRRLVDATHIGSEIPLRHAPAYPVASGAKVVPPHVLVELADAPSCFTVVGAGKTAMDTCCWLLDQGVDPDRIRWIRARDPWVFDRAVVQPLDLVAAQMEMQARWVEAVAQAADGNDFARRLENHGALMRIDPDVEPQVWRGATVSRLELAQLRTIERVERGRVAAVGPDRIVMETGVLSAVPDELHIDCTAAGLPDMAVVPVFQPGRLTIQHVSVGSVTLGAATLGAVESLEEDDAEKNRLSPALRYTGRSADLLDFAYRGLEGFWARSARPDLRAWHDRCRLNPLAAAKERRADPAVAAARALFASSIGPALERRALVGQTAIPRSSNTSPSG